MSSGGTECSKGRKEVNLDLFPYLIHWPNLNQNEHEILSNKTNILSLGSWNLGGPGWRLGGGFLGRLCTPKSQALTLDSPTNLYYFFSIFKKSNMHVEAISTWVICPRIVGGNAYLWTTITFDTDMWFMKLIQLWNPWDILPKLKSPPHL